MPGPRPRGCTSEVAATSPVSPLGQTSLNPAWSRSQSPRCPQLQANTENLPRSQVSQGGNTWATSGRKSRPLLDPDSLSGMKYQRGGARKSAPAEGEGGLQVLERTPKYHRGLGGVQSAGSLEVKCLALSRERLAFIGSLGRGGTTGLREPRLRSSESRPLSTNRARGEEGRPKQHFSVGAAR